jgi:DNA polymerase-1
MDRTYPRAMACLRDAEEAGRTGRDIRTYGGRLLRLGREGADAGDVEDGGGEHAQVTAGHGRFARNAVIQGAAAELFKAWAATVRSGLGVLDGEIVMCLHDELVVHVPAEHTDAAAQLLLDALAATTGWWAAGSPVRFVAEVASGESWAAAH